MNLYNFDDSIFDIISIERFPKFIFHIFGYYSEKSKKWCKSMENNFKEKLVVKIIPNILFTDERTIKFVIEFLSSDCDMFRLFIHLLIKEYQPSYIVNLFPPLIILHQVINKAKDSQKAIQWLKKIYKQKQIIGSFFFKENINFRLNQVINILLNDCDKDKLIESLATNLTKNQDFQSKYGRIDSCFFDLHHCHINNNTMLDWIDLLSVEMVDKNDNQFAIKLVMNDLFTSSSLEIAMPSSLEAYNMYFILETQLDLVNRCHCTIWQSYCQNSCCRQHWQIDKLIRDSNRRRLIQFIKKTDFNNISYELFKKSVGDSFDIILTSLTFSNSRQVDYVCIKKLTDGSKSEDFWQMCTKYRECRHPNILEFYGLLEWSCGFFREYSIGPLIYDVYQNKNDFIFNNVIDLLLGIGSALDYLSNSAKFRHGNVNFKSIYKVDKIYKLSEPSITENNEEYKKYYSCFSTDSGSGDNTDVFLEDLFSLLLSCILIFFMNKDLHSCEISELTFLSSKCNEKLKSLILSSLRNYTPVNLFLDSLYEISQTFTESQLSDIIIPNNNEYVHKFLDIITRDSRLFEMNEIDFNLIKLGELIGKGHFSYVFKGTCGDINIAIKQLKSNQIDLAQVKKELRPGMTIFHRNVLRSYGYSINNGHGTTVRQE